MWDKTDFYTDLIGIYSETGTNLAQILKETSESDEAEREKKLKKRENLRKYFEDKRLMDFLGQAPPLWDVNLDHYVYLARSSMALRMSAFAAKVLQNLMGLDLTKISKAIELNPNDEKAWYAKGVVLERLGKKDEAEHCFQRAKELGHEED